MAEPQKASAYFQFWAQNAAWRDKLSKEATYKALDMVEDDLNINTRSGMGWKEMSVLTLGMLGTAALILYGFNAPNRPTIVPPSGPTIITPDQKAPVVNVTTPQAPSTKLPNYRMTIE
jgi:hypothetical protein